VGATSSQGPALRPGLPGCVVEQDRDVTRRRLNRRLWLLPPSSANRRRTELPGAPDRNRPQAGHEQASRGSASLPTEPRPARSPTGRLLRISPARFSRAPDDQPAHRLADRANRTWIGRTGCFSITASGRAMRTVIRSPCQARLRDRRLVIGALALTRLFLRGVSPRERVLSPARVRVLRWPVSISRLERPA
jgi:hypothetical protein